MGLGLGTWDCDWAKTWGRGWVWLGLGLGWDLRLGLVPGAFCLKVGIGVECTGFSASGVKRFSFCLTTKPRGYCLKVGVGVRSALKVGVGVSSALKEFQVRGLKGLSGG